MGWGGEICLVVGCSDPEHFLFGAEIERLKERNPNLQVFVAMSALKEDLSGFHRGRIRKELLLEWVPDISARPRIHLCASPGHQIESADDLRIDGECLPPLNPVSIISV